VTNTIIILGKEIQEQEGLCCWF